MPPLEEVNWPLLSQIDPLPSTAEARRKGLRCVIVSRLAKVRL